MSASTPTSSFTSLPLDLLVDSILVLLPLKDLLSLSCTCRNLHSVIHENELVWKRKITSDYRFPSNSTGRTTGFKTLYRKLRKPQVWVWGQNMNERLGLNAEDQEDLLEPVLSNYSAVPTPLRLRKAESIGIIDLQAGGWSFHGLDVDGNVWCWGTLDGTTGGWNPRAHRFSPTKKSEVEPIMLTVKHLPKFKAISCGRSHACGISDEGNIYEWHSWSRVAKLLSVPWEEAPGSQKVAQLCASWDFSALLSSDGVVYFWKEPSVLEVAESLDAQFDGLPTDDTLGTVYNLDSRDRIICCPDLPDGEDNDPHNKDKISKIACGEDFIVCLTRGGKIYKLDISNVPVTEEAGPHRVLRQLEEHDEQLYFRESITQAFLRAQRKWEYLPLFCESDRLKEGLSSALPPQSFSDSVRPEITHISAQYRTFVAYSVESPSEHQPISKQNSFVFFGAKDTGAADRPRILPDIQQRGVIQVALGDYHSVALLSNGNILTWGSYSEGALGLGHSENPHRKLVPLGSVGRSPQNETEAVAGCERSEPQYELGTQVPTMVQSFTGTEYGLSARMGSTDGPPAVRVPARYVFSVTAAGWHSGCLAFSLEDDEDLDYGLGVLEKDVAWSPPRAGRSAGRAPDAHDQASWYGFRLPNFRIGFAGRFMRGGARGGLLRHHGLRDPEPHSPPEE